MSPLGLYQISLLSHDWPLMKSACFSVMIVGKIFVANSISFKLYKLRCTVANDLDCMCTFVGADNFYDAIEDMIGYRPNSWMKWSWMLITPVLCVVSERSQFMLEKYGQQQDFVTIPIFLFQGCFVFSLVKYKPLTYNKLYKYPDWSVGLGWALALASMICIPMMVVIKIIQSDGSLIEVRRSYSVYKTHLADLLMFND